MREAFRRPTVDGVLDPTREVLASALVLCFDSLSKLVLVPLHYPPQGPRAFRRADPFGVVPARFFIKTTHPKFHSNFEGILPPKMVPKASQNYAKFHKKCMFFPGVFSYRFFFNFGRFFGRISRRPTLDFIAIYNEFVGCAFFRKVGKSIQNDLPKSTKMTPKMPSEAFKNRSKNEATK